MKKGCGNPTYAVRDLAAKVRAISAKAKGMGKKKPVKQPLSAEKKAAMLAKRLATKMLKKALADKQRKRDADNMRWYNGAYASPYE